MKWRILLLLLLAVSAFGSEVRLYLKDGTYQLVREYQALPDRVQYLSAERSGDWEVIPIDLVDLDRTKKEIAENEARLAKEAREDAEEEAAIREEKQRASSVPEDSGVYYLHGDMLEALQQADVIVVTDKKRTLLRGLSMIGLIILAHPSAPTPVISKKTTLEVEGVTSKLRLSGDQPEFYFRLASSDGLALVKLSPKGNARAVETVLTAPITNDLEHKREIVQSFTKQYSELVFKIWPEQTLPPGEYAAIEFDDPKGTLQVWDFGVD